MIRFVGDICLADNDFDVGFGIGSQIERGLCPFSKIHKRDNEIWIGNLECVLSDTTIRQGYNRFCFRSSRRSIFSDHLIDCYAVANNHIMEHGNGAYKETIKAITDCGKDYVGSKWRKTTVVKDGNKQIAITCFSLRCDNTGFEADYWYAPDASDIKKESEKYLNVDCRVAYLHWGVEFMPYPFLEQQKFAHYLVDIGYDLIIGVHPHVLQGFEEYKGKRIYYSIGNFVFNMAYQDTKIGLIVSYDVDSGEVTNEYVRIGKDFCPVLIHESEVPERLTIGTLNSIIGKKPNIEQYCRVSDTYLKEYRKSHHISILRNVFRYQPSFLLGMIMNYVHDRKK